MKARLRPLCDEMSRRTTSSPAGGILENGLDCRLILTGPHELRRGPPPDQQADRPHQNGFPGAGFPGEHVQAGLELQLEPVDDGKIADGEEAEHRARSAILSDV